MTFLAGFSKRKALKIAAAGIPSSPGLTAYPKRFRIDGDTDIGGETTSQKLAVTLADGVTQVPYGARYFNVSGGVATLDISAKFDLSSSLSNGDTFGYLYYDHTATDQSNKSGVLDSNRLAYYPLEDSPTGSAGDIADWSGNNNGTSANSPTSTSGQVANGLSFNGTSQRVNLGTGMSPAHISVGATFKLASSPNFASICSRPYTGPPWTSPYLSWLLRVNDNTTIEADVGNGTTYSSASGPGAGSGLFTVPALGTSAFHRAVMTYDGTNLKFYLDGSLIGTGTQVTGNIAYSSPPAIIGADYGSSPFGGFFPGVIDELTIDSTDRSAAWITYENTDQFSNSSTFTLGAQETSGGQDTPELYGLSGLRSQQQMQQLLAQ